MVMGRSTVRPYGTESTVRYGSGTVQETLMRNMVHYGIGSDYCTRIILASYTRLQVPVPYGTVRYLTVRYVGTAPYGGNAVRNSTYRYRTVPYRTIQP